MYRKTPDDLSQGSFINVQSTESKYDKFSFNELANKVEAYEKTLKQNELKIENYK